MKFETKLQKILLLEDSRLKLLKLYNLGFDCVPNSYYQKQVEKEITKLNNRLGG